MITDAHKRPIKSCLVKIKVKVLTIYLTMHSPAFWDRELERGAAKTARERKGKEY